MISSVIFDIDDTLYDYQTINNKACDTLFNYISQTSNNQYTIQQIETTYHTICKNIKSSNNPSSKFNKEIYIKILCEQLNISIKHIDKFNSIYEDTFYNNIKLENDLYDVLKFLKSKNIKIALISNGIFHNQYKKIKTLNILDYVDYIETSDTVHEEKPNHSLLIHLIHKLKDKNMAYIGDNIEHDILPAKMNGILPFLYNKKINDTIIINDDQYYEFGRYNRLLSFFKFYYNSIEEYIYLSKFFGQSYITTQGQGGNISVKNEELGSMIIKTSGSIMGNANKNDGFCLMNIKHTEQTSLLGNKPSMEYMFHSFTKKYTIHIHFVLSNIYLCSDSKELDFKDLNMDYKIIDYYPPGKHLAEEISKKYDDKTSLYFLKNHGIIITTYTLDETISMFFSLFKYFNNLLNNKYSCVLNSYFITDRIYRTIRKPIVCSLYSFKVKNIVYCMPDISIYLGNILNIETISTMEVSNIPDLIIYNNNIYIIAENITKLICIKDMLDSYIELSNNNNNLMSIDSDYILNMTEEKYRKNI